MQQNAVQGYKEKGLTWFKGMGRIDKAGLVCMALAGVLIAVALLFTAISYLVGFLPFLPQAVFSFPQAAADFASGLIIGPILIGGGLLLLGGPRRRGAVKKTVKVVLFVPGFIWSFFVFQVWDRGDAAAFARRMNNRARREQEKTDSRVADIIRRIEEGMPQHEFEALLIEVEEEAEAGGTAAHDIEALLSNLEDLHQEANQRRELVERRRQARARRRAGLADPDEDEMDDADREMLARMQQDLVASSQREAEAQERARQERYEDAVAYEDENTRAEERQARSEERQARSEERRARQEDRRERDRNR